MSTPLQANSTSRRASGSRSRGRRRSRHPDDDNAAPRFPLSESLNTMLMPKTIGIWHDCEDELARVWAQAEALLQGRTFDPPRNATENRSILNEADLSCWFTLHIAPPMRAVLDTVLDALRTHADVAATEPSTFIDALRSVHLLYHAAERTTRLRFRPNWDAIALHDEMRRNDELRTLLQPHPQSILDLFDTGMVKPRTDFEFVATPKRGFYDQTCLVVDFKNPHELTPEVVTKVLFAFEDCVTNRALREHLSCYQANMDIPVRAALSLDTNAIDADAKLVLRSLIQLYHSLVVRRQRYGLLTSGVVSLLVTIDWTHANEPGQHLKVRLVRGDPWEAEPAWSSERPPSMVYSALGLLFLQLEHGLVSEEAIDQLVQELHARIRAADDPKDANDDVEPTADSGNGSVDGLQRRSSKRLRLAREPPGGNTALMNAALELIDDDESKQALLRILNDEQSSMEMVSTVDASSLPSLIAYVAEEDIHTADGVDHQTWSLIHPRPWIYGPLPAEHNERLAMSDDAQLASRILGHSGRSLGGGSDSDAHGSRSQPDKAQRDARGRVISSKQSSVSSHRTMHTTADDTQLGRRAAARRWTTRTSPSASSSSGVKRGWRKKAWRNRIGIPAHTRTKADRIDAVVHASRTWRPKLL